MTHMVPDVVGTMGMSSASVGMDQGIWNWGASSRITMFLQRRFISPSYKEKGVWTWEIVKVGTQGSWHSRHSTSWSSSQNWSHWHHTRTSVHWPGEDRSRRRFAAGTPGRVCFHDKVTGEPTQTRLYEHNSHAHLKSQADLPSHQLLHGWEHDGVTHLLPLTVSFHLPVQSRRLASLGVSVVRPHGVHLGSRQTHTDTSVRMGVLLIWLTTCKIFYYLCRTFERFFCFLHHSTPSRPLSQLPIPAAHPHPRFLCALWRRKQWLTYDAQRQ